MYNTRMTTLNENYRYANMDYLLLSALRQHRANLDIKRLPVNIIYDIACQYSRNLFKRMPKHDASMQISKDIANFRFFIPKFHLAAHGSSCQTRYSLNWNSNVGRTYGERIEQEWSHINKCAAATLEQGPGARHATLDDQWGGWNWRRTIDLGK